MKDTLSLYTCIRPELLHTKLIKGFIPALIGVLIIVAGGIFLDTSMMKKWGLVFFLFGISLITYGLFPYRQLSSLTQQPDMLRITRLNRIELYSKGTKLLTLPLDEIKQMYFVENANIYGIGIFLKSKESLTLEIHNIKFDKMQKKYLRYAEADIFLPYFSSRSFQELQEISSQ